MPDITDLDKVQAESKAIRTLDHRNIVKYEDDFVHQERGNLEPVYFFCLIMEYCPNGDMTD